MKVLALTHAHLNRDGLSPVSCERADSLTGVWGQQLKWHIDVIHTKNTKWRGIWPDGKGLNINIIEHEAPERLLMGAAELFAARAKALLAKKRFVSLAALIAERIKNRVSASLVARGMALPPDLVTGQKWGKYLSASGKISGKKYDFIFACVGYGDEYLLETALVLSNKLRVPMVVDFRDLWSEHHEQYRFTKEQRKTILSYEKRLLANTVLLSVPQKPMVASLEKNFSLPVHVTSHAAHTEDGWGDGRVIADEFRLLYSGKIYADNPALGILLEFLQRLSGEKLMRPVKCHFFVDDVATLEKLVAEKHLENSVVVHGWITPPDVWKEMRSAHVLLIFDGGFYEGTPLMMTKVFQYAHTGRPILVISKHGNSGYSDFLSTYDAGKIFTDIDDALTWTKALGNSAEQYQVMPPLRKVPSRTEIAIGFGRKIEETLKSK